MTDARIKDKGIIMARTHQLVVFTLDDQSFALNLTSVKRIVRAVEVTHVPEAPDAVLGVINVEGSIIPVVNSRRRLGLPERDLELNDLFIIVQEGGKSLALVADEVRPVMEIPESEFVTSGEVLPGSGFVRGVAKVEGGMILSLQIDKALSSEDSSHLYSALEGSGGAIR